MGDASESCYQQWQGFVAVFGLTFVVPFFLTLGVGTELMRRGRCSAAAFLCSCIVPIAGLLYWLCNQCATPAAGEEHENQEMSTESSDEGSPCSIAQQVGTVVPSTPRDEATEELLAILSGLYIATGVGRFWQPIIVLRTLGLVTVYSFCSDPSLQAFLFIFGCTTALVTHIFVAPFKGG